MNFTRRLLLAAGLSALLIPAGGAWANGTPFFFPNPRGNANNPNALVYAGNIKDTSGRYVDDVQVLVGFGLAPVVIGLVRSRTGWPAVFATAMGLFVVSSLLLLGTRTRSSQRPGRGVLAELAEGFGAVRANPLLLQLILAAVMAYSMTGPMQILLPKLAREVLGLSELQRGAYLGLMAFTLILGGVSALVLGRFLHHGLAILAGTAIASLFFASLSQWSSAGTSATALAATGMLGGLVISFIVAGIQGQAPEALRGRIMSIFSIISQVVPATSGIAAGALVRSTGTTDAILVAGVGLASVAGLAAAAMPALRRMRT